jgi:hypothetical protein
MCGVYHRRIKLFADAFFASDITGESNSLLTPSSRQQFSELFYGYTLAIIQVHHQAISRRLQSPIYYLGP